MQNLLTKEEPEDAYSTDLHKLQKKCLLNYHMTGANRKTTFPKHETHFMIYQYSYTKLNVPEDLEFIIRAFSSH